MATTQVTTVLLYFSVAGTCSVRSILLVVMSAVFSSDNSDPLTIQPMIPLVALVLQLKVAVDPSEALTDLGVLTMLQYKQKSKSYKCVHVNHVSYFQVICKWPENRNILLQYYKEYCYQCDILGHTLMIS